MRLTALFMTCLLISGCGITNGAPSAPPNVTITLAISSELAYTQSKAVDVLVSTVKDSSKGSLSVHLVVTDTPLDSLDSGAQMALISNEVAAMANSDFEAYVSPFYFSDYNHFSITLGSKEFHDITDEKTLSLLGAKPIGALYGGSYVMLNGRPASLTEPDGFLDGRITVSPNQNLAYMLEKLGMKVTQKSADEVITGFNTEAYSTIECPKSRLGEINMPSRSKKILLSESFHRVDVNWIMISEQALASLPPMHLAAISEGVAAAIAYNDNDTLTKEANAIKHIESMPSSIEPANYQSFTKLAKSFLEDSVKYNNLWSWQTYNEVKGLIKYN